jgi:hypothetical protein
VASCHDSRSSLNFLRPRHPAPRRQHMLSIPHSHPIGFTSSILRLARLFRVSLRSPRRRRPSGATPVRLASQTPSVATSCSNSCRRGPHSLFPRIVNDSLCRQYATTRTKGQTASPWHSAAASLLRHTIAVRSMRSNPIPRLSRWSPLNAENLNYGNATVTHRSARTVCIDASASGN